jgi:hypothetical protein
MKKLFGLGLALTVLALVPQQASAWSNIKFGVGLNFHWQTADNHIGKHLWHNGPVPHPHGHGYGHGPAVIYMDPHHAGHGDQEAAQAAPPAAKGQAQPVNLYHYSSHQGYYYQEPSYYHGQDYWYGW